MANIIVMGAGLGGVACVCTVTSRSAKPDYEQYVLSALGIEALKR